MLSTRDLFCRKSPAVCRKTATFCLPRTFLSRDAAGWDSSWWSCIYVLWEIVLWWHGRHSSSSSQTPYDDDDDDDDDEII